MTKDREIVLMLIQRKRLAYKCWKRLADGITEDLLTGRYDWPHPAEKYADFLDAQYLEAHNAAECARRILYGHEL